MNIYYDRLMKLNGADELKKVINKWETLSTNIKRQHKFNAPIILPDLLLYTKAGYGNTELLSLLSEYVDSKKNLMDFYGDAKFFEFELNYCPPGQKFSEMYRFLDNVQAIAGFRNEFKGIARININEWIGHHKENYFLDFLQLLKDNTSNWLIVLTISNIDRTSDDAKSLESVLSMYLRIETLTLHMPSDKELAEYAASFLNKYGFELEDSAKEILIASIEVLRQNKYFNGFNTIADLCNDILYSIFSEETTISRTITADMLKDFSADSEYIKRTIIKFEKNIVLGF